MKQNAIENNAKISGEEWAAWLDAHPILKARIIGLVGLVENAETIVLADEAERRVIEETGIHSGANQTPRRLVKTKKCHQHRRFAYRRREWRLESILG